ncbi:MAG: type I 3-dehydroquinate dehydratase [Sulfolobales archaeon]|nr:type I 3-dehydroquinate dehydratase [Sulfolobales archaeon]MDW7969260.1 type I 3-dehydroquinate dehydratase [Sulfolobales archaeon]
MKPLICASLTKVEDVRKACEADLVEVRIDMVGSKWVEVVGELSRPWIACNRKFDEGGLWRGDEGSRVKELITATDLGAEFVDIELTSVNVEELIKYFKGRGVKVVVSKHITTHTPDINVLKELVDVMIRLGADVWKVATKANSLSDNLILLKLIRESTKPGISLAMGELGILSRVLSPLMGGFLTYASVSKGAESAPGQLTLNEIKEIYRMLGVLE